MTESPIWRVNRSPRIPALELGEYMASDDDRRETMRRNLKYERLAPSLLYRELNRATARFLASPIRDRGILAKCREYLEGERDNAISPQQADNAKYALRSLDAFERSLNALPIGGVQLEHAPLFQASLVSGVKVSVQPTVLIRAVRTRGADLRGAMIVDAAKGTDPKSDELKRRAKTAMGYTSMLLHDLVSNNVVQPGEKASAEHCCTFHTHRQELVAAPANYRKSFKVMEAALRTVAGMWVAIEPPSSFDPGRARYRD